MSQCEGRLDVLQARLDIRFDDSGLLELALTHSSFVNEYPEVGLSDNQRLEFLGDAMLDLIVGEWLFRRYPDAQEGELTTLRAHIVRTDSLAALAQAIDLGSFLRLGKGEASSGGRARQANLCAAFEALAGAAYLDQGMAVTKHWIESLLGDRASEIDDQRTAKDAKSRLQEQTQAQLHITPSYCITAEEGPDHAKVFTAQAIVTGQVWGEGQGNSKQAAEQAAAQAALASH